MRLLEDVFIIENLQVINEGTTNGPMKIRGCFQRADEANNNKRIYRKPLLEREITKLADAMNERRLMGELDHPQHDSVKLSNVSHLITGLNMKGNEVIGEAEILNTPSGKVAQALIEGGVKVGISSRGMGTVTEELDGKRYVNEDFKLITWDIVADPSTRGAFPGLTESTQIQNIIDTVYPEAQKVKNFTTLLKEELSSKKKYMITESGSSPIGPRVSRRRSLAQTKLDIARSAPDKPEEVAAAGGGPRAVKTSATERKKFISTLFTPPSRRDSSTQLVNFMRDKLNELRIAGKSSSTSTQRTQRAISPKFKRAQGKVAKKALEVHKLRTGARKREGPASTTDASVNLASSAKTKREQGLLAAVQRAGGVSDNPPVRTIRRRSQKSRD